MNIFQKFSQYLHVAMQQYTIIYVTTKLSFHELTIKSLL